MQITNWYLPVSWISIIVTQTWCDSVLWWFSGVIHGQKWAQNQPKLDIWVIFEVWKGRKMAQNGSFLRPEVWPKDQILAKKKSGPQKFKSSQKKLIPAQLGKFLGSKVGPFWPSDCLRGPPRKSKMQKIFLYFPLVVLCMLAFLWWWDVYQLSLIITHKETSAVC